MAQFFFKTVRYGHRTYKVKAKNLEEAQEKFKNAKHQLLTDDAVIEFPIEISNESKRIVWAEPEMTETSVVPEESSEETTVQ